MLPYRPSLGQFSGLTSGLTSGLAKQIVDGAEPVVQRIVRQERNRYAEALIGGIPFAVIAVASYVGTKELVPSDSKMAKIAGYGISALTAAGGAWLTLSRLTEGSLSETPSTESKPSSIDPVIQKASQAIVAEAEPKIIALVSQERKRIAGAGEAGLPFAVAGAAAFAATMFLVNDEDKVMKTVGYTGTALLLGIGGWVALDKEMAA